MKKIISHLPIILLFLTSLATRANSISDFNVEKECNSPECIQDKVDLLEAKIQMAKSQKCLPPDNVDSQNWFESNPLSLDCLKFNKEIEDLFLKVEKIENYYNSSDPNASVNCCNGKQDDLIDEESLTDVDKVNEKLMCTEEKQKSVYDKCAYDLKCIFMVESASLISSPGSLGMTAYTQQGLAKLFEKADIKNCDPTEDNCATQMIHSFIKSVMTFFEGAWSLIKWGAKSIWEELAGVEDHSSTSQLSAAKASEDDGIFQMLRNDFSGTMLKLWEGLAGAVKHWLANNIYCQEWSGQPQFSECLRPSTGFACMECKTMVKGTCAFGGALFSEVVPAFLTGGIATAVKYGVQGAAKLSKIIKVSSATMKLIKESQFAMSATKKMTTLTTALKATRIVSKATLALRITRAFLLRPMIQAARKSISGISSLASKTKSYIMLSKAGPMVAFGGKALKVAGKVIIFPIDNPWVNYSFRAGEQFFDKTFQLAASARVLGGIAPVLTGEAARVMSKIDEAYAQMFVAKYTKQPPSVLTSAEKNFLGLLKKQRQQVASAYLEARPNTNLNKFIEELFPELEYGKFGKHLSEEDILLVEAEIEKSIMGMKNSVEKERLLQELSAHKSSLVRKSIVIRNPTFKRQEVINNTLLSDEQRVSEALKLIGENPKKELVSAINKAHDLGEGAVFEYPISELLAKKRILKEAGLTDKQIDILIRGGFVGRSRPQDVFTNLSKLPVPNANSKHVLELSKNKNAKQLFIGLTDKEKISMTKAIKTLQKEYSTDQAVKIYQKYKSEFNKVKSLSSNNADAESFLAEYIRRQKAKGLTDKNIQSKIAMALKDCSK